MPGRENDIRTGTPLTDHTGYGASFRFVPSVLLLSGMILTGGCAPAKESTGASAHPAAAATDAPVPVAEETPPQPDPAPEPMAASASPDPQADLPTPASEPAADPLPEPQPVPIMEVYRPDDNRVRHDPEAAAQFGIHRYTSAHLELWTDIDPELAVPLPALMDQALVALAEYFGPPLPARDGAPFQLTGYIMRDRDRFRAAGMLPEDVEDFAHGRHRDYEFWMNDQEYDYYRRHLMIHEGTHCFMMIMPATVRPPLWYLEGMAELFGTHRVDAEGRAEFGVMPDDPHHFVGFGRIDMIARAIADGEYRSVKGMTELSANDFIARKDRPYAWSWAFCKFLDTHPRYRERFRELSHYLTSQAFYRHLQTAFTTDMAALWIEWELFAHNLCYGYDIERAAIDFVEGVSLDPGGQVTIDVNADAGWQSSVVRVEAGQTYRIEATGQTTLADDPRPWISEPQGITIEYASGKPIGRLVAAIQSETPPDAEGNGSLRKVLDVGRGTTLTPAVSGTLYFRVNDNWGSLANNNGAYSVTIRRDAG